MKFKNVKIGHSYISKGSCKLTDCYIPGTLLKVLKIDHIDNTAFVSGKDNNDGGLIHQWVSVKAMRKIRESDNV